MTDRYDRLNRLIDALSQDHAPTPFVAEDEEERAALQMAAQLRLLRPGAAAPRQRFAARMRRRLAQSINPRPGLPRRRLLFGGAGTLAGGLVAGLGVALGLRRSGGGITPTPPGLAASAISGWAQVGRLQDVPQGGAFAFTTTGFSGYVLRNGDQLSALSAICNHLGCHVQWQPGSEQFLCPCDNAEFDRAGMYLQEAYSQYPTVDLKPLTRLAVRLEGDVLYVKTV